MHDNEELLTFLQRLRHARGFDVKTYVNAKVGLLRDYFFKTGVNSCVVAVSGGVDSAVVLGLLKKVLDASNSPLQRITPLLLPVHCSGATNQPIATRRGALVARQFGLEPITLDLSLAHHQLQHTVDQSEGVIGNAWASGQLVSYIRTPALYYYVALLQQSGLRAIVCGTTNRDEGAYLGFFGKASDGMVDLQVISDLHKSEVYQVASYLDVPTEVLEASPTGDTFDGRTDQEMIGTSYDLVELYLNWLCLDDAEQQEELLAGLSKSARRVFAEASQQLVKRHQANQHKYFDGTPAIHLDVYQREVVGGWQKRRAPHKTILHPQQQLVGYFALEEQAMIAALKRIETPPQCVMIKPFNGSVYQVKEFLFPDVVRLLLEQFRQQSALPADQYGYPFGNDKNGGLVGSFRATSYNEKLARALYERFLLTDFPRIKTLNAYSPTNAVDRPYWRLAGINPVFRFIEYKKHGYLVPHYDCGYDFQDNSRYTLMSVLIYLTPANKAAGGVTRFLWDKQFHLPTVERDFSDHHEQGSATQESLFDFDPLLGEALVFDHRLLHEATSWLGEQSRIVLRTDLIFERCGVDLPMPENHDHLQQRLLQQLGLTAWHSSDQIDQAYQQDYFSDDGNQQQLIAWQILRDPFLAAASRHFTCFEQVEETGFFIDKRLPSDLPFSSSQWMTTPLEKIRHNLMQAELEKEDVDSTYVVLVTTGGFAPLHQGHLEMMELAKNHIESQGKIVLGGFISPDHRAYLEFKDKDFALTKDSRLECCERMVATSSWLMIDPWQTRDQKTNVNFTGVVDRLAAYLSAHIKSGCPIQVVYVCGGDNARFALSFIARGQCVIVPRLGYEQQFNNYKNHIQIKGNPRIYFCTDYPVDMSSSRIRQAPTFSRVITETASKKNMRLQLRDEGDWPLLHWKNQQYYKKIQESYHQFKTAVIDTLRNSYEVPTTILIDDLEEQKKRVSERCSLLPLISLDPCIGGDYNLAISRYFFLTHSTDAIHQFGPRPGSSSLEQQLAQIAPGKYILFDDDIYSGSTIEYAKRLLANRCDIVEVFSLLNNQSAEKVDEVCDLRDFLIGGYCSGLAVILPNQQRANAPYFMPYVRPYYRLSMPHEQEQLFSLRMWTLNLKFFQSIGNHLTLADTTPSFQALAYYLGFSPTTKLDAFCQWHIDYLNYNQTLEVLRKVPND